jgi:hypothetical protein
MDGNLRDSFALFFPLLHEGENFARRFVDFKLEREVKTSPGL